MTKHLNIHYDSELVERMVKNDLALVENEIKVKEILG